MQAFHGLIPLATVSDVLRSIEFYTRLGFEEERRHTPEGDTEPVWAWLRAGAANLMVSNSDEPMPAGQQSVIFYMYSDDVAGYRAELEQRGVKVGDIEYPFWSPRGEFRVDDPDGYCIMVSHT